MTPEPPVDWDEATAAHSEYVTIVEREVVEWVWAKNASWERLEPIWAERYGQRPNPRRLRERPSLKADAVLYGFDAAARVVVAREFGDGFGNDDVIRRETLQIGERLFVYATEGARGVYRRYLTTVAGPVLRDGLLVRLETWSYLPLEGFFHDWEDYEYEHGRLAAVHTGSGLGHVLRLRYDHDGELLTVTGEGGFPVYRRPLPGEVARARKLVRAELPVRIAAWAKRVAPDEPVACVALQYGEWFENALPPALALATRAELEALGPEAAFSPPDYERLDDDPEELRDARLGDAFELLNREWRSTEAHDEPRRLLTAIAKAVPGLPYPVYATDLHQGDLAKTVPARLRRAILE